MLACSTTHAETVTGYDRDGNPIEIDIDIPTPTQPIIGGGSGTLLRCTVIGYWPPACPPGTMEYTNLDTLKSKIIN
jgi:hypothetical protein